MGLLLSVAVVAVVVAQFVPQAVKAVRGDVQGVSAATYWLSVAGAVMWISFAVDVGEYGILAAHSVAGLSAVVVLVGLARHGSAGAWWSLTVGAVALPLLAFGPAATVSVGAFVFALGSVPQFVKVLRSQDVSGVAVATWVVGAFSTAVWIAFGLVAERWQVWLPALIPLLCAVGIVARTTVLRPRLAP